MIVQRVQIWRICGPLILLNESRTVRLQPILCDALRVSWGGCIAGLEGEACGEDR